MDSLRNLKEMASLASGRFNQYNGEDFELPQILKDQVKEINSNTITYNRYSAVIETKGNQHGILNIYMPNQWFYIASYFTDFYNELQKYKKLALKVTTKERLKELNGKQLSDLENKSIQSLDIDDNSKDYLVKFITDYTWWSGAKTIDRGDFYVSPILSNANLVNASQTFVADLCAFLADKQELVKTIIAKGDSNSKDSNELTSLQQIYYGAPGTGKSDTINKKVTEDNSIRTTFHPDSDYASFVGCYKPVAESIKYHSSKSSDDLYRDLENEAISINNSTDKVSKIIDFVTKNAIDLQYIVDTKEDVKSMQNLLNIKFKFANETYLTHVVNYVLENQKKEITYKFVPQAFTRAYIEAWKDTSKPYYLVIEEINRGNCAQIFGDIFQLLDRGENGFSSYKITPDTDLQQYLAEEFAKVDITDADIKAGRKMQLPNNLHILATMNTSDQSLFPIDSAFKRRWEWKYIPIKNEGKNHKIVVDGAKYDWFEFMKLVNDRIENVTDSEDKQIGYWFAKANEKYEISAETLVSKVIFYLWNDVFKDYAHSNDSLFHTEKRKYKFREFYHENGDVNTILLKQFLKELGLKDETSQTNEVPSAEDNQEPEQPAEE